MEHQKILNTLNEANDSEFVTRKWNIANDKSKSNYGTGNEITYDTEVLNSKLCDYDDPYILVRGDTIITGDHALFIKCLTEIHETTIDDAEDLDLVVAMYNLIEYNSNFSATTESLWFYSKEATNFNLITILLTLVILNLSSISLKYYKAVVLPANTANGILKNAIIAVSLKYLINFWISLKMPLINCKVELKLKWRKNYALSGAGTENEVNGDKNANNIIFTIKDIKLYVSGVTL